MHVRGAPGVLASEMCPDLGSWHHGAYRRPQNASDAVLGHEARGSSVGCGGDGGCSSPANDSPAHSSV
jgi:hypothetical protein